MEYFDSTSPLNITDKWVLVYIGIPSIMCFSASIVTVFISPQFSIGSFFLGIGYIIIVLGIAFFYTATQMYNTIRK